MIGLTAGNEGPRTILTAAVDDGQLEAQLLECPLPRFKCPARIEAFDQSLRFRDLVRFPQLKIRWRGLTEPDQLGWLATELSIELTEAAVAGERDDRLKFPLDSQHIALVLSTETTPHGCERGQLVE